MAATYKLVMSFEDSGGNTINHSYRQVQSSISETIVKNVMDAMITNGSIFKKVPVKKLGAKIVKTEETVVDINNA